MSVVQMREFLKKFTKYKGSPGWVAKVNAMSDKQVIAVYYRVSRGG